MDEEQKFFRAVIVVFSALVIGLVFISGGAAKIYSWLPEAAVTRENRQRAAWYQYRGENCVFTGQTRSHSESHRVGLMNFSDTITEYEWKCKGGDVHWDRDAGVSSAIPPQQQ